MIITEQKALTQDRLMNLIKTKDDDFFTKVTCGNKVIHVAYTDTTGFLSFMANDKDKTYVFISEKLSDKQREAELKLIFEDKELHYFSSDEIKEMNKLAQLKELKKISFKTINYNDINTIIETSLLKEYVQMFEFKKQLEKVLECDHDRAWNNITSPLYMFKLGVMQGKREERARRRKSQVVGGSY